LGDAADVAAGVGCDQGIGRTSLPVI